MADQVVGLKITADGSEAVSSVGNIKKALREAQADAVNLAVKFGETSKEAFNAAKKVALLKDQISDTKDRVELFNPGAKFAAFGSVIRTVAGGFSALTGAAALFGVEGKEIEKTLLKVQSALAITEGINTIADAADGFGNLKAIILQTSLVQKGFAIATTLTSTAFRGLGLSVAATSIGFKALRAAIIATGIGALVVGITFLIEKIIDWTSSTDDQVDSQATLEAATTELNKALGDQYNEIDRLNKIQVLNARIAGKTAEEIAAIEKQKGTDRLMFLDEVIRKTKLFNGNTVLLEKERQDVITAINLEGLEDRAKAADKARGDAAKSESAAADAARQARKLADDQKEKDAEFARIRAEDRKSFVLESPLDQIKKDREEERKIEQERQDAEILKLSFLAGTEETRVKLLTDGARRVAAVNTEIDAQRKIDEDKRLADIETRRNFEIQTYQAVGNALGALGQVFGQQTAAGKALGIAQATINTFIGVTEILRAKSVLPEPFATISKIANITATVAAGFSAVRNIAKVSVPGGSGGGSVSTPSIAAPSIPQGNITGQTTLDQNSLNQIGNATSRAFVVESDVTNNQERITRLNRAARLG